MTGTLINAAAVLIGGVGGLLFGARLPERVRETVFSGLGLFVLGFGVYLFLETQNPLISLGSVLLGGLLGEWWRLEDRLQAVGSRLEARFVRQGAESFAGSAFARGFLTASVLFCVGPLTILGAIQDGLTGDYSLLAVKSMLDGFASLALASMLGTGVLFSVATILVYQGGISLIAAQAQALLSEAMITEMTAAGGIVIMGLAVGSLLELRKVRAGNLLPALAVAPAIVWIAERLSGGP